MVTVAILGATGYTALEAMKLLLRHPEAEIVAVTSRQEGSPPVSSVHPSLVGRLDLPLEDLTPEEVGRRADCVFGCLPHCASAEILPKVLAAGARVVDFSADYRLDDAATYLEWYGHVHPDAERLGHTAYGLPELFRESIRGQRLVANPGCYATAIALSIAPMNDAHPKRPVRDRRHHHRFQERGEWRGAAAHADDALPGVQREHVGLQRRPPPPHA